MKHSQPRIRLHFETLESRALLSHSLHVGPEHFASSFEPREAASPTFEESREGPRQAEGRHRGGDNVRIDGRPAGLDRGPQNFAQTPVSPPPALPTRVSPAPSLIVVFVDSSPTSSPTNSQTLSQNSVSRSSPLAETSSRSEVAANRLSSRPSPEATLAAAASNGELFVSWQTDSLVDTRRELSVGAVAETKVATLDEAPFAQRADFLNSLFADWRQEVWRSFDRDDDRPAPDEDIEGESFLDWSWLSETVDGDPRKSLGADLLKRPLGIEPSNVSTRKLLARAASLSGLERNSADHAESVARELQRDGSGAEERSDASDGGFIDLASIERGPSDSNRQEIDRQGVALRLGFLRLSNGFARHQAFALAGNEAPSAVRDLSRNAATSEVANSDVAASEVAEMSAESARRRTSDTRSNGAGSGASPTWLHAALILPLAALAAAPLLVRRWPRKTEFIPFAALYGWVVRRRELRKERREGAQEGKTE